MTSNSSALPANASCVGTNTAPAGRWERSRSDRPNYHDCEPLPTLRNKSVRLAGR